MRIEAKLIEMGLVLPAPMQVPTGRSGSDGKRGYK